MVTLANSSLTQKIVWMAITAIIISSIAIPVYAAKPQRPSSGGSTLELVELRLVVNGQSIVLSPSQTVTLKTGTGFYVETDVKNTSAKTINVNVQFYFNSSTQTLNSDIGPGDIHTFKSKNFKVAPGYNTLSVLVYNTSNNDAKSQSNVIVGN